MDDLKYGDRLYLPEKFCIEVVQYGRHLPRTGNALKDRTLTVLSTGEWPGGTKYVVFTEMMDIQFNLESVLAGRKEAVLLGLTE